MIIASENGELSEDQEIIMMQKMISNGMAWKLNGAYGREAMNLIKMGLCALGKNAYYDYYGNRIPSRDEVKDGSKGSIAYCADMQGISVEEFTKWLENAEK